MKTKLLKGITGKCQFFYWVNILNVKKKSLQSRMDERDKEILMKSIIHDDDSTFIEIYNSCSIVFDQSFFDYELLKTALHNKRINVTDFLLNKGHRVRNTNKVNLEESLLHVAMRVEDQSVLSAVLSKDVSIYDKNLEGYTALYAAFKEHNYSSIRAVLDYVANCDITFDPDNKIDVLHFHIACVTKHINSVKLFLSFGFDVNSHLSLDSSDLLVNSHLSLDSPFFVDLSSLTPLHYLVRKNSYGDLFKILLDHSDLSIKNSSGSTVLHCIYVHQCYLDWSSSERHYSDFSYLEVMTKVFNCRNETKFLEVVNNNGVSHFHLCCSINCPDIVQAFISNGVDVNCSTFLNSSVNAGFTPLHFAIRYHGSPEIIELLIKNGADCNKIDNRGRSPLHLACQYFRTHEHVKIIDLLLQYSANPTAIDEAGDTPIHLVFDRIVCFDVMGSLQHVHHLDDDDDVNATVLHIIYSEGGKILDKLLSKMSSVLNLTNNGISIFHIVCTRNNTDKVKEFLNSGVIIDSYVNSIKYGRYFNGYTALHFAVLFDQKAVVEVLLKRNAQVNIGSEYKKTPLHLACEFSVLKFRKLLSQYCKSNEQLNYAFHRATQLDLIKLLILHGASIDAKNQFGITPLFSLFSKFDTDLIQSNFFDQFVLNEINPRLIEIINIFVLNKVNINDCTNDQESIFHVISSGYLHNISDELMQCLITAGADINAVDKDGLTPLHYAAKFGKPDLLQSFLKFKASINAKSKDGVDVNCSTFLNSSVNAGFTPLHFAITNDGSPEIVELLLKNGADCNKIDYHGQSPLHLACQYFRTHEHVKIIDLLLQYSANPTAIDDAGNTPIHLVFDRIVCYDVMEILQCVHHLGDDDDDLVNASEVHIVYIEGGKILDKLLSRMSSVLNLTNKYGISIFHIVCTRNNTDKVKEFLNSGVIIDSYVNSIKYERYFKGYTALHFAVLFDQKAVVEVLLKRNAQVNIESEYKKTPLHLACEFSVLKFRKLLSQYCKSNEQLNYAFHRAIQLDLIKLLILHGASIDAKNQFGMTPLFSLFSKFDTDLIQSNFFYQFVLNEINPRLIEIINIFVLNKVNINDCTNDQESIFHVISSGYLHNISDELMQCLITAGADINAVDKDGLTPLHYAANFGKPDLLQSFLKFKASINAKSKDSKIPLQLIIEKYIYNDRMTTFNVDMYYDEDFDETNIKKCMRILLEEGSEVNYIISQDGQTLLQDAISYSIDPFVVVNLLNYGADINLEDSWGNSAVCSLKLIDKNKEENRLNVFIVIFLHVQRLLALGLFVSDKVQKTCIYFQQYCKTKNYADYYIDSVSVYEKCIDELNTMKMNKIDSYTSLYNILLKDKQQMSNYVANETLLNILDEKDFNKNFPFYGYLLKLQYKKGLLRCNVLKSANASIMQLAGLNLPDPCCDAVFKYLTDEDIINLKTAIVLKRSSKRKLQNNAKEIDLAVNFKQQRSEIQQISDVTE